jgi:hypothetical protein
MRVFAPHVLIEFVAFDNKYDDTFMASNFSFPMYDNTIETIWISYYVQPWICSCAFVDRWFDVAIAGNKRR